MAGMSRFIILVLRSMFEMFPDLIQTLVSRRGKVEPTLNGGLVTLDCSTLHTMVMTYSAYLMATRIELLWDCMETEGM